MSPGAETERSRGRLLLMEYVDGAGDPDRSVKGVEGDSAPSRGDVFQPKKEENLEDDCGVFFQAGDEFELMLCSETDLGSASGKTDMFFRSAVVADAAGRRDEALLTVRDLLKEKVGYAPS